ncbi:cytochrome c biogenesis protein CcdA, partial [Micromonospora sp. BL1]
PRSRDLALGAPAEAANRTAGGPEVQDRGERAGVEAGERVSAG